jgi:hypothetical protein
MVQSLLMVKLAVERPTLWLVNLIIRFYKASFRDALDISSNLSVKLLLKSFC